MALLPKVSLALLLAASLGAAADTSSPARAAAAPPTRHASRAAVAPKSLEGAWMGRLLKYRIVIRLRAAPGGALAGTLDSPDQGATGIPIDAVRLDGDTLRLDLPSINARFAGGVSARADEITGRWIQNSVTLPLTLNKGAAEGAAEPRKPQEPVPPLPYAAKEVSYENPRAGVRLAGTLTIPDGLGPFPAVLLISGSGPEDRDEAVFGHRPFLVLSDYLTRRGIAVLRVDDRGVGGSGGTLAGTTLKDLVDDALCGVAYLRARPEIDSTKIGLLGHSEGGMVAPAAAVRAGRAVSYIVLLAAPGVTGDSLLLVQSATMRRSAGVPEAEIARESGFEAQIYKALKAPGDSAAVAPLVRAPLTQLLAGIPEEQVRAMGGRDEIAARQLRALLSPGLRFMVAYDPRPVLAQVRCPVLAMNGEKDQQVSAGQNLPQIEAALRSGGNSEVAIREMPRLNHLFQTCELGTVSEYATLDETFAPAALDTVATWIARHTGATAPAKAPSARRGKR